MAKAHKLKELYGTSQLPEQSVWLSAGGLHLELTGANVGSIHFGDVEVLRGISFLVRDENWGTCPAKVIGLKISRSKNSFVVTYRVEAANGSAKLTYEASIRATENQLVFHAVAKPNKDFKTNRTGFVILHPINGMAGKPLIVTHTDGTTQSAHFPKLISPGQPFFDVRALEHAPTSSLKAHVLMEGNKFEMEDQRNWTDASYKTYVCSLLDPWPYILKGGSLFEQRVTLTVSGKARTNRSSTANSLQIGKGFRLPEIGVAIPQQYARQSLHGIKQIIALKPKHLTCTLGAEGNLECDCAIYEEINRKSGIPITLEVILQRKGSAKSEMFQIAKAVQQAGLYPMRIVVSQAHDLKSFQPTEKRPPEQSYEEMASAARTCFPAAEVGGGMMSYFPELNRKQPPKGVFDFITHSICPIVHDARDSALMQTLESLPHVFASTKAFIGKAAYHLGPSSIGARMNPYGTSLANNPNNARICLAPNDPRQNGTFALAWNLGVLLAAGQAGLRSVTLSSIRGPQGLLDNNGKAKPLFYFLEELTTLAGKRVTAIVSQNPSIFGFIADTQKGTLVWLANRDAAPTTVSLNGKYIRLSGYQTRIVRMRYMRAHVGASK